jgi:hypothetical protein
MTTMGNLHELMARIPPLLPVLCHLQQSVILHKVRKEEEEFSIESQPGLGTIPGFEHVGLIVDPMAMTRRFIEIRTYLFTSLKRSSTKRSYPSNYDYDQLFKQARWHAKPHMPHPVSDGPVSSPDRLPAAQQGDEPKIVYRFMSTTMHFFPARRYSAKPHGFEARFHTPL